MVGGREPDIDQPTIGCRPVALAGDVSVDLTSEVRWFFDGALPASVLTWFAGPGTGLVADRCDTYRLDRQIDTGVKRRFRTTLELKLRLDRPKPLVIGNLDGRLERWKRWSPADDRVRLDDATVWVDVDKTIIKRRFDGEGREVVLSEANRAMTGEGCDVEIAAISVNSLQAWTFALAAFGEPGRHEAFLACAWAALAADRPRNDEFELDRRHSCGYPEWLARLAAIPAATGRNRLDSTP